MKKIIYVGMICIAFACSGKKNESAKVLGLEESTSINKNAQDFNWFAFAKRNGWNYFSQDTISLRNAEASYKQITSNRENWSSPHYDDFRQIAIQVLVDKQKLTQSNDKDKLEYYFNQLLQCKGQNPRIVCALLEAMKPLIGTERVHEYAQSVLTKRGNYEQVFREHSGKSTQNEVETWKPYVAKLKAL